MDFYRQRQAKLRTELKNRGLWGLVVTHAPDWHYLTGFTGESGVLLVAERGTTLVTDGRFTVQAKEETTGVKVVLQKGGLYASVGETIRGWKWKTAGFDPTQLTVAQFAALKRAAGSGANWKKVSGLVPALRAVKDASELEQMRKAAVLASEVVERAIGMLKPGVRELEIAAEVEFQMRKLGASGPAFQTIVAFGERAALPHARPTARKLGKNELVVLDLGAILGHYCSDITRTVYVGKAPQRVRRWYEAVLEAQQAAIQAVQDGAGWGEVDAAARDTLTRFHLDRYFVHSTGHGLGLEVHEDPRLARGQTARLVPGNVVTIEPGVYVAGVGGIRIEDDVAVHRNGNEVLTRAPRDFIEI